MVAKEIDALLTCMGPKRGLAVGRAAGRPENVGDVLRGVGRKKCVAGKPGQSVNRVCWTSLSRARSVPRRLGLLVEVNFGVIQDGP